MAQLLIPGDAIPYEDIPTVVGPGITQDFSNNSQFIPVSAGIFSTKYNKSKNNRLIYIDSNSKRYIPQVNDFVIGIITGVFGENYRVALQNFSCSVQLSSMAFANASKKNKPNLKTGQIVYARVSSAIPEIDIEIECYDSTTGKDGGFGLLEDGYLFDVNLNYARELLLNANCPVLEKLASKCKFELAIGMNGKIWLKSEDLKNTLAASNYIINCQSINSDAFDLELKKSFKQLGL